jgi:hypothetical protein
MRSSRPTLALTVFCALVGFVSGCGMAQFKIPGYESIGALASGVVISIAAFAWFRSDSESRLYSRSTIFNIAYVGFTIFVLPYYLMRSRGIRGGARAIGVAVLIYILYLMTMLLGALFVRALRI